MIRLVTAVLMALVVVSCVGCGGMNWSVTPYAGVSGNTDDEYYQGMGWQAGVSVTLYSGRYPAPPAVIQPAPVYRNETKVENNVSSSSSSSSSSNSSATQSQTQNQEQSQSQSQSQNQDQSQSGGGEGGDDDDHGHGHDDEHGGHGHDDDHPD
ncbi:MAG: hypothetical protein Q7S83_03400 [bacterium]|nr:hypothetical protein [bacterium]